MTMMQHLVSGAGKALAVAAAWLVMVPAANAGWRQVQEADAAFDLLTARRLALETVGEHPSSAEAVAASAWWLGTLNDLPEPEAMLTAPGPGRDPEVGFLLARIQSRLDGKVPPGVLDRGEFAGPFGAFDVLDLERGVVPPDHELPPLETRWHGMGKPFRLRMQPLDGWFEPPVDMVSAGVFLAAWNFRLAEGREAWLVVEASGGVNISLDGRELDRLRWCGVEDPGAVWYRVELEAGCHRLRAEMASSEVAGVRVSLLDASGEPVPIASKGCQGELLAGSGGGPAEPPAAAALIQSLDRAADDEKAWLVAAAVARGRLDPRNERKWLEHALEAAEDSPWPHLGLAQLFLTQPTGGDRDWELRRAREHLRSCGDLSMGILLEHVLARRQRRHEDADRLLDQLVESFDGDSRILQLWVRHALHRGWTREAEDGIARLNEVLPSSTRVAELRLLVLEGLERWDERNRLMRALAESETVSLRQVEELHGECLGDVAAAALDRLRQRADDPTLDLLAVRILADEGRMAEARAELDVVRKRWGNLPTVEELSLTLAAEAGEGVDAVLERALEAEPANLRLRTLAWRRGAEPFFEPFRVDGLELAAGEGGEAEDVDAVLILDQAVERCFANGSSMYYYHGLTKAYTPAGARQAAELQQMEGAVTLRVRIVKPDGSHVVPTDLNAGEGGLVLSEVEPGDLVEEEYVAAIPGTGGAHQGHLSPYTYRFADAERAFGLSEYVLLAPPELELEVEGNFTGLEREQWDLGDLRATRWRAERVPPIPREPFAPPVRELMPWLSYGFGVSWEDVGDAVRDRVLEILRSTPDLEEWAAPHLDGSGSIEEARRVVEAVIEEVEAGRALLDMRSSAGESFSRRKGNRLAIVAQVLMSGGWSLDMVLARPVEFAGTHLEVPSMESFFEPVLRATSDQAVVWIDIEEERRGIDHIRPELQRSDALVLPLSDVGTAVSYLERLPEFDTPELEERIAVRAEIEASGAARIHFEMPMWGGQAERLRQQIATLPEERVQQAFRQMAASLFPGSEDVEGQLERQEEGVLLRLDLELPDGCESSGGGLVCRSLILARPLSPALASLPERQFPIVLQLPVLQRVELEVVLPAGFAVRRSPRLLETRWGSVNETLETGPDTVRSVLRLRVDALMVTPEEYPEFVRFCHAADELITRAPEFVRDSP